jgi:DNA-binding CsgD family transcriptional regulator
MVNIVLLVRMVGFTLLCVALALAVLTHLKSPRRWLKFYIIYMGIEALYSVSFTFVFYARLYLADKPGSPGMLFVLFQIVTATAVVYTAPRFLLELVPPVHSSLRSPGRRGVLKGYPLFIPPLLFLAGSIATMLPGSFVSTSTLSALVYGYFFLFFLWAFMRRSYMVTERWRKPMLVFLVGAALWHLLWIVEAGVLQLSLSEQGPLPSILLTNALFEIFWAGVVIVSTMGELRMPAKQSPGYTVPLEFKHEYGITRREEEIIPLVCEGASSKDIAETLYISSRTVENHVQNIYRKCGIRRRLELINLLSRYQT